MDDSTSKWKRMTLTKAAKATALGMELVSLLGQMLRDGVLQPIEVNALRAWLSQARTEFAEIPSIAALRDLVESALADGQITDEERQEIVAIMLRILPACDRATVSSQVQAVREAEQAALREEAEKARAALREEVEKARLAEKIALGKVRAEEARRREEERASRIPRWHGDPVTEPQLRYLKALGANFDPETITKGAASLLINQIVNSSHGVTNRQVMVLRFWDKLELREFGKQFVSEWMDRWYAQSEEHVAAWELWKEENGDWGCKDADPLRVPIGCANEWLARVRSRRKS